MRQLVQLLLCGEPSLIAMISPKRIDELRLKARRTCNQFDRYSSSLMTGEASFSEYTEGTMLSQIHEHIVSELQQNSRTDTIFVVTAIAFNLIVLGINSAVAGEAASSRANSSNDLILGVFILMSLLVNCIAVVALNFGKQNREKLLRGLLAMYADNQVIQYYDASLMQGYGKRYLLFIAVIVCLALTSIVVPLIVRLA